MNIESTSHDWFALQVRSRWERSTAALLRNKGYGTLLPTYSSKRRVSGCTTELVAPLFPGYVFCSFEVVKRLPILVTPGVISVVSQGRIPTPLEAHEVTAIRAMVDSGVSAEPWPYLEAGQRVRIESNALRGVEGILVSYKGAQRIVVSITLLRRSVALEIDRSRVSAIETGREALGEASSDSFDEHVLQQLTA